jgi:hypothetical protein
MSCPPFANPQDQYEWDEVLLNEEKLQRLRGLDNEIRVKSLGKVSLNRYAL